MDPPDLLQCDVVESTWCDIVFVSGRTDEVSHQTKRRRFGTISDSALYVDVCGEQPKIRRSECDVTKLGG